MNRFRSPMSRVAPNDGRHDLARAVAVLAERLPDPVAPLARVVFNYRWTWAPDGPALFRDMEPALWRRSGWNPRWMIEALPPHRLRALAADGAYVERVRALAALLDTDLARPPAPGPVSPAHPVAYFCSEFAVHASLPLYGGGLGVLAADLLKTASDVGLPMVGVGLLYREGYFHQRIDFSGQQIEYWTATDFERLPMVLVTEPGGQPLTVTLDVRHRPVHVQVWRVDIGRVPLFLLDTDRSDNAGPDRWITTRLYIGDRHTRLAQYGVLGIGGTRALAALGIEPCLVHLNEGHAALSGVERLRVHLAEGRTFAEALEAVRQRTVFTTHTPVAAGNEWYGFGEVEPVLGGYADELRDAREAVYALARVAPARADEPLSITPLALRLSRAANGVSRRHGEVARAIWQGLWPDRSAQQVPIGHVTNGVHVPTWMAGTMQRLLDRHLDPDWRRQLGDPQIWARLSDIPDAELWEVRHVLRAALVDYVREQSVIHRLARGEPPDYVEAAARMFDPDTLTIGFARRVATYKRLHLVTHQLERALALLAEPVRKIQLVLAGKAHPQDEEAKTTLRQIFELRRAPHVSAQVVFLEDYDVHTAAVLTAGADLWVNLPRPPQEASGTSGMKAATNGGLNLSVLDGWWVEAYEPEIGWAIATPEADPGTQDEHDAAALFDLLEREVIPLFYDRDANGLPVRWLARVKRAMAGLVPRFCAERMLSDYLATLYTPDAS
jgi:starch phosphorylase